MAEKPDVIKKVYPVIGDITKKNFGLTDPQLNRVIDTAEVVFHLAASLKLEASLKTNITMNLIGTRNTLNVAKQIKNLILMVHLSTAFCNIEPKIAEEKVYDFHQDLKDVILSVEFMEEWVLTALEKRGLGPHPNTYTYTKRLGELLVRNEYANLPLCIARPSIVTPALKEPLPGWVDCEFLNFLTNLF